MISGDEVCGAKFRVYSVCLWGRVIGRKVTAGKVGNKKLKREILVLENCIHSYTN